MGPAELRVPGRRLKPPNDRGAAEGDTQAGYLKREQVAERIEENRLLGSFLPPGNADLLRTCLTLEISDLRGK